MLLLSPGRCLLLWEGIVSLIFYFVAFMVVGDVVAYWVGLFTEYAWGS
jgi:hypothetical protein